jgi:dolichol-phosphate mannosyltransferase
MVLAAMRLCIIIPVYNESAHVQSSLTQILSYSGKLAIPCVVAAIDDGSRDATASIIRGLAAVNPDALKLISHEKNAGYGAALRTGIAFAIDNSFDYCLFMDSDMTNHPKYLAAFCEKILQGFEYIKANRYAKDSSVLGVPWTRKAVSLFGNGLARLLYGLPLHDLTNGFRAVKTDLFRSMKLREQGFAIIMEELYWAKKLTRSFAEAPYVLTARTGKQGKTRFRYDLATYSAYLKYGLKSACNL